MEIVTEEQIRASLKQCMDPEIPISIIDLGLIYGVDISEKNDVNIKMTMTTKGCPLHDTMVDDVKRYTRKVAGVNNVNVDIVWDPPWSMDKISDEAKSMMKNMGGLSTPAPLDYEAALPQGVGKMVKQEDGSMMLANEHDQGFMVNQAIIDFWRSCNGEKGYRISRSFCTTDRTTTFSSRKRSNAAFKATKRRGSNSYCKCRFIIKWCRCA